MCTCTCTHRLFGILHSEIYPYINHQSSIISSRMVLYVQVHRISSLGNMSQSEFHKNALRQQVSGGGAVEQRMHVLASWKGKVVGG